MANYIHPKPGDTVGGPQVTLEVKIDSDASNTVLAIPSLQDITVNAAQDVFTWTQLDSAGKKQLATTATNSLSMNLVLDQDTFFGLGGTLPLTTATEKGIFGMSNEKDLVEFELYLGNESDNSAGKYLQGKGYITGLAPTVNSESPLWVSPITITVDGDYTVTNASTF